MKITPGLIVLVMILGIVGLLGFLMVLDYSIAVDYDRDASPGSGALISGSCPVCGSESTVSEGLYYFREEAFDSTLTWGIPYKQFRKIYCSDCGIGRLVDYDKIKDIFALNASIVDEISLNYKYYGRDGQEIYPYDQNKWITENDYLENFLSGDSIKINNGRNGN